MIDRRLRPRLPHALAAGSAVLLLVAGCAPATRPPGRLAEAVAAEAAPAGDVALAARARLAAAFERKARRARALPEPFMYPQEAQTFFARKRLPADETVLPVERYLAALEHTKRMPQHSTATGARFPSLTEMRLTPSAAASVLGGWTPLGPGNIGGRTRALVVDPTRPATMYAGGVAGGVWKTTDGGGSWFPTGDAMANLAVGSLAMDPYDPDVLYAGTGEGYFNIDAVRGAGIFKTTDAGGTWSQLPSTTTSGFYYVNKLVVSPNDSSRLYAATRTGVFRTLNGGGTWTQVLNATSVNGCLDLVIRSDAAADHVLAACGTVTQGTVYRNIDAGGAGTWTPVLSENTVIDGTPFRMGRTSLALAPSDQNVVYALTASIVPGTYNNGLNAVFRSLDGGATWTARVRNNDPAKLNTVLLTNPVFAFYADCGLGAENQHFNLGWYANTIAVDPSDPGRVWAGGVDLFRSDDGGVSWGLASHWWASGGEPQYAHADHHAILFHPQYDGVANRQMLVAGDGGLFRTDDARAATATGATAPCSTSNGSVAWTALNHGYGVTQFAQGLPYPGASGGTTYVGGATDHGTIRGTDAGGIDGWSRILGGDGGHVAVDPGDSNILYATLVYPENSSLSIQKSLDGGASWSVATTGIDDQDFLLVAPLAMDPAQSARLWTGGAFVWRTTNGAGSWTQAGDLTPGSGSVSAVAVAPTGNGNRVLIGMSDGWILQTINALGIDENTNWADCPAPTCGSRPQGGYVSSVAYDPTNANVAYATYATFGVTHVMKSTDGGRSWSGLDGSGSTGIPDVPAHAIAVDPANTARLYVGTDVGVFSTQDGGATWAAEVTGFPNVITEALAIGRLDGADHVFAFTHGRGAWRVATGGGVEPNVAVSPLALAFGDTLVGEESSTEIITVRNTGAGTLTVASVTLGGGDGGQFSKKSDGCSGQGIGAGASCAVGVSFKPTTPGPKSAVVTVVSSDRDAGTVTVTARGKATVISTLTVGKAGTGSGTVTSSPAGIDCGAACAAQFLDGTAVMLTASPAPGSVFTGWTGGGCGGTGSCTVTLAGDTQVTASFSSAFTLSIARGGSGGGVVTSAPPGIDCGAACAAPFAAGATVTLTATAAVGSSFAGWSGGGCGSTGTCVVTLAGDLSVTAKFSASFTDDPLVPQSTPVRAVHVEELRGAINTLRANNALAGFGFTDPSLVVASTPVRAIHVGELRAALDEVYDTLGVPRPTYTDPALAAGTTAIRAVHLSELRTNVRSLE